MSVLVDLAEEGGRRHAILDSIRDFYVQGRHSWQVEITELHGFIVIATSGGEFDENCSVRLVWISWHDAELMWKVCGNQSDDDMSQSELMTSFVPVIEYKKVE